MHAPSISGGRIDRRPMGGLGPVGRITLALALIAFGLVLAPRRASAANETLTVVVEGPGYVTADQGNLRCPPTCSVLVAGEVTLTAHPDDGSAISGWAGCPAIVTKDIPDTCTVSMSASRTVTAIFVDPVAFTVLDDVVVGPEGSFFAYRKVLSGDRIYAVYYDPLLSEEEAQLFVSNGQPGSGRFIAVNSTGGTCAYSSEGDIAGCSFLSEYSIQPFGERSLIFAARDGTEPAGFGLRLFVSDGTPEGTHPLRPSGATAPCAGYYGANRSGGRFSPSVELMGSPEGAVFAGVEVADADCTSASADATLPALPRRPWFVSPATGAVTSLERGFVTTVFTGMAGGMVALFDGKAFAMLTDCMTGGCVGPDLYWTDLSASSGEGYAWALVGGSGLPAEAAPNPTYMTSSAAAVIFQVPGLDGSGLPATLLYATDGPTIEPMAAIPKVYGGTGTGGVSEGIAVGEDYYFYAPHDSSDRYQGFDLNRYSGSDGSVTAIAQCGDDATVDDYGTTPYPPMAALGDTLYFACGTPIFGNGLHEYYNAGLWKVDAGSAVAVQVWEPAKVEMKCLRGGSSSSSEPTLGPVLQQGNVDQIVSFGGAIYFAGADTSMFDPDDSATCMSMRGDLYVYTGSGDPQPIPFNPTGPSRAGALLGRLDDLVAWANDGLHGVEPWTGDIVPMAGLTLAISGPGTVSAAPYAGTPLSHIDDCAATCSYPFPSGSRAVLTAVPGTGASFAGWSSNCESLPPDALGHPRCLVRMSSPRTVGAVFAGAGDVLAVGASGPTEAGPGGLIPYSLVVGNLTGAAIGDAVLDVSLSAGSLDLGLTPWCQSVGVGSYSCALAPIPALTAKALRLFAVAPTIGSVDAEFAVSSVTRPDSYSSNDTALVASDVSDDLLAATLVSYPSAVPSGGLLTYRVDVRNLSAATTVEVDLRAGFNHLGMAGATFAPPCSVDGVPFSGVSVSATCSLGSLAPGDRVTVEVAAPAPQTTTDIPLAATFSLWYLDDTPGILTNDVAGPVSTLVLAAAAGDQLTQESDAPLSTSQTLSTSSTGGTTTSDPTGIDVELATGFAGVLTSTEIQQTPPPAALVMESLRTGSGGRLQTLAASGGAPRGVFACTTASYLAGCWTFETLLDQTVGRAPRPVLLTLTFDPSGFVDPRTGRILLVRRARLFFQADGGGAYSAVALCPHGVSTATYGSYAGTAPCLIVKKVDANGDYAFVVVAPEGGRWKTGL